MLIMYDRSTEAIGVYHKVLLYCQSHAVFFLFQISVARTEHAQFPQPFQSSSKMFEILQHFTSHGYN